MRPFATTQLFNLRSVLLTAAGIGLLAGTPAFARCTPPTAAPVVPPGATSTAAQMKAAHDLIQAYVQTLETYQTCNNQQATQTSPDISAETKAGWSAQGDAAIDAARDIAAQYSLQAKAFSAAHK